MRRHRGSWDSLHGEDKGQGNLINVYHYLMGGNKNIGVRLFSVVPNKKARDIRHKLK